MDTARTVLVIDDESATLTMFRLFLTAYGYNVLLAEDGKSGLALMCEHRPDIVFTDLKMPEMDGFEVLKEIKRIAPSTEVIVITGHGDMDLVVQALNLDATDFIDKPIQRSALNAALQRATERLLHPVPQECHLSFSLEHDIGCIRITGTLRREHREQMRECCQQARQAPCQRVLMHFMDNAAVNGAGIAELIKCLSAIRQTKKAVAIVGLSENFKAIFKMVGIGRFADLCDVEADAVASLSKPKNGL
ncbi:MAG: hypothetical protein VR64_23205 [Desulfatitalea sp. BRH_c12]|nr:MAG: hypothetical protein VR64_23205 [Desulfatitalea sp. BRH_c12]